MLSSPCRKQPKKRKERKGRDGKRTFQAEGEVLHRFGQAAPTPAGEVLPCTSPCCRPVRPARPEPTRQGLHGEHRIDVPVGVLTPGPASKGTPVAALPCRPRRWPASPGCLDSAFPPRGHPYINPQRLLRPAAAGPPVVPSAHVQRAATTAACRRLPQPPAAAAAAGRPPPAGSDTPPLALQR